MRIFLGFSEKPETFESRLLNHKASQLPLNPVCPVINVLVFLNTELKLSITIFSMVLDPWTKDY